MTDQVPANLSRPSGFWKGLLLVSLMLNVLVIGTLLGRAWMGPPPQRAAGPAFGQFVPNRFFADLQRERRRELADYLRASRQDMQKLRGQSEDNAQKLATELEQSSYDSARVGALIDSFTTGPESIAMGGGKLLKDFYAKLSTEERQRLAKAIREEPKMPYEQGHGWRGWWRGSRG